MLLILPLVAQRQLFLPHLHLRKLNKGLPLPNSTKEKDSAKGAPNYMPFGAGAENRTPIPSLENLYTNRCTTPAKSLLVYNKNSV